MTTPPPSLGVLIRFANSEATLPAVLAALRRQTLQPTIIVGVASHSTDGSRALMEAAGAQVIEWAAPYHHSRVLNFGLRHLHTDLVLILSSHTVLESADALERMAACFDDGRVACASAKWDADPFYSNAVTWNELQGKGLRFGSIYSNSMGMIRRAFWEDMPFNETLVGCEDYAWSVAQIAKGRICHRLDLPFSYQRSGGRRDSEFAQIVFHLAREYQIKVAWLGPKGSLKTLLRLRAKPSQAPEFQAVKDRLIAWCGDLYSHGF